MLFSTDRDLHWWSSMVSVSKPRVARTRPSITKRSNRVVTKKRGTTRRKEPVKAAVTTTTPKPTVATAKTAREAKRNDPTLQQMRAGAAEGFKKKKDGTTVFNGTGGRDDYEVRQKKTGELVVENKTSGKRHELSAKDSKKPVRIETHGGNDRVVVDPSVKVDLTVDGGAGDDEISALGVNRGKDKSTEVFHDRGLKLVGGAGNDRVTGSDGADEIDGGDGDDVLSGGKGRDRLDGGKGRDALHGGEGDDQVLGGAGDDQLYGNDGADLLMGGDGKDVVAGGEGADALYVDSVDVRVNAGASSGPVGDGAGDMVVAQKGGPKPQWIMNNDTVVEYDPAVADAFLAEHPEFRVRGSDALVSRTRADLAVLLSTEQGRGLFRDLSTKLKERGETLELTEKIGKPGGSFLPDSNTVKSGQWNDTYGNGANRSPVPVLFHELVHAYQDLSDTYATGYTVITKKDGTTETVKNKELQATGLPWIDRSGKLRSPDEFPYTDNKLRKQLGLWTRDRYGADPGTPTSYSNWDDDGYRPFFYPESWPRIWAW